MDNIEKQNIFREPKGYFDTLPDQVLEKYAKEKTKTFYLRSMAAAAVVVLGFALYILNSDLASINTMDANLDEEVALYINAGHWEAEDILSLTENPDSILDEIILTEWNDLSPMENDALEEDYWF